MGRRGCFGKGCRRHVWGGMMIGGWGILRTPRGWRDGTRKEKAKKWTLPAHTKDLLSCLSHITHHFVQGNFTKRNNPGKEWDSGYTLDFIRVGPERSQVPALSPQNLTTDFKWIQNVHLYLVMESLTCSPSRTKNMDSGTKFVLAVWPWASQLTSLCFNFLIYTTGIIIIPTS